MKRKQSVFSYQFQDLGQDFGYRSHCHNELLKTPDNVLKNAAEFMLTAKPD